MKRFNIIKNHKSIFTGSKKLCKIASYFLGGVVYPIKEETLSEVPKNAKKVYSTSNNIPEKEEYDDNNPDPIGNEVKTMFNDLQHNDKSLYIHKSENLGIKNTE